MFYLTTHSTHFIYGYMALVAKDADFQHNYLVVCCIVTQYVCSSLPIRIIVRKNKIGIQLISPETLCICWYMRG